MLQKRAIRIINESPSGILKLNDLYEYQVTLFILDFIDKRLLI